MASSDDSLGPGALLIAPPLLNDPNFQRAVVLLCEHTEEGSFGLVLNRGLSLKLGEVLEGLSGYDEPLSLGGPVQPNTLHFLHRYGEQVPEAVPLTDDIYWGGDFEALKAMIRAGETSALTLRFFLGYAGWSAGQLAEEVQQDMWILSSVASDDVFSDDQKKLWRTVLRRMGGEYAVLANFPDDPRMN